MGGQKKPTRSRPILAGDYESAKKFSASTRGESKVGLLGP